MACSFTPKGDWFCFDAVTGETLSRGHKDKAAATRWIAREQAKILAAAAEASAG